MPMRCLSLALLVACTSASAADLWTARYEGLRGTAIEGCWHT